MPAFFFVPEKSAILRDAGHAVLSLKRFFTLPE
jgi:hypothetical protein